MSRAMIRDPRTLDTPNTFSSYDLAPEIDRCINCEKQKKIIATITIDQRSGPICVKCFKSYQE